MFDSCAYIYTKMYAHTHKHRRSNTQKGTATYTRAQTQRHKHIYANTHTLTLTHRNTQSLIFTRHIARAHACTQGRLFLPALSIGSSVLFAFASLSPLLFWPSPPSAPPPSLLLSIIYRHSCLLAVSSLFSLSVALSLSPSLFPFFLPSSLPSLSRHSFSLFPSHPPPPPWPLSLTLSPS